ncbi:T-cell surface glycoprotein CD3 zeta chain [Colossoma macropomum]|uniref:T-cell surface glycoprotein CD3 zeta chain n=1 Tax=Colossoma macropomum TaxID=42526 RepID=UPI001864094F|nr:T-cell surface glycoprotein CD3 zeta chain [Colossoma macropomum]
MGHQKTGALAFFVLMLSPAEASSGLYDPRFCYILDVFLLIYGIIITALFLREKFCKPKGKVESESDYQDLKGVRSTYDGLRQRDPESGRARGGRRDMEDTYTRLQKKTDDTYKEIQVKKDRRQNDQVYQGLSSATKDTYDSLHMQPLPPRR